jgi:hypothetical protein
MGDKAGKAGVKGSSSTLTGLLNPVSNGSAASSKLWSGLL